MQSYHVAVILAIALALGCRGSSTPPAANNGAGGGPPPAVDNGNGNGNNGGNTTADAGKIVDPTRDFTTERDVADQMDMAELIKALGEEKLAAAASDELATRGEQSVQPLIEALDSGNDAVKERAIFTLGRLGPSAKAALPKLQAIADDSDDEVQSDAAKFAIDAIEEN